MIRLSVVISRLMFAVVLAGVGASPGCGPAALEDEVLNLKISGSCSGDVREFVVEQRQHALIVSYPHTATSVPFPTRGALDQAGHSFREGGWQLWGCLSGREPCPGDFRRCTGRREAWQLNVTCLDGAGAPLCEAVLTE